MNTCDNDFIYNNFVIGCMVQARIIQPSGPPKDKGGVRGRFDGFQICTIGNCHKRGECPARGESIVVGGRVYCSGKPNDWMWVRV